MPSLRVMKIKTKINRARLSLKDFVQQKKQAKWKDTHRIGENICKSSNWQGIDLQNIQTAHVAQLLKKKKNQEKSK